MGVELWCVRHITTLGGFRGGQEALPVPVTTRRLLVGPGLVTSSPGQLPSGQPPLCNTIGCHGSALVGLASNLCV